MADEKKITKVDRFAEMVEIFKGMNRDDLAEFCELQIEQANKKADRAKEARAKKKEAGDELQAAILGAITETPITPDAIVEALGIEDLTKNKVVARVRNLVANGSVTKTQVDGKVAYQLANVVSE